MQVVFTQAQDALVVLLCFSAWVVWLWCQVGNIFFCVSVLALYQIA